MVSLPKAPFVQLHDVAGPISVENESRFRVNLNGWPRTKGTNQVRRSNVGAKESYAAHSDGCNP